MPFTSEQDRFIVMADFRSGTLNPDGNWSYSLQSCIEQFMQQYPDEMIEYDIFKQHKCRLVHRFETKNCICQGKSTGRPTVLTENVIENIQRTDKSKSEESCIVVISTNWSFDEVASISGDGTGLVETGGQASSQQLIPPTAPHNHLLFMYSKNTRSSAPIPATAPNNVPPEAPEIK
ncbi:hypothetical protein FQA39_LY08078 [Lamprigera yunnana]|nr:hypothetical protein FQA39_LY08078 [Lamprigera yunnana]